MAKTVEPHPEAMPLRRNLMWTSLGYFLYTASQWGMLAVLTRFTDATTVGRFGLALAITSPIMILAKLGLRLGKATDFSTSYTFNEYCGLRVLANASALVLIGATTVTLSLDPQTTAAILLMGVVKAVDSQSDIMYGLFQNAERMDYISKSLMYRGALGLLAFAWGVIATGELSYGLIYQAAVWVAVLLIYDSALARSLVMRSGSLNPSQSAYRGWGAVIPSFHIRRLVSLAWLTVPLGIGAFLVELRLNLPRYFVERLLNLEALGYLTAVLYVLYAATLFVNSLGQSASAPMARLYVNRDAKRYTRLLVKLVGVCFLMGAAGFLCAVVAGTEILSLLYGADYGVHADIFIIVMLAGIPRFVSTPFQQGITSARKFGTHLAMQAYLLLIGVVVCYPLTLFFGLPGAAWSVVVMALIQLVVSAQYGIRLIGAISKPNNMQQ